MAEVVLPNDRAGLSELLASRGFLAAEEEAEELLASAADDHRRLDGLITRRLTGEPLAWITGHVSFCGLSVRVDPRVYVPRWQTEALARRAAERLPPDGTGVDLCTGSGAIAKVMMAERPSARVLATDVDATAVACAAANGVEAYQGDLFAPLPGGLEGTLDVVVAVVPYVPTGQLALLQRDTFTFESTLSYDGGPDGARLLRRVLGEGRLFLRRGGTLLLELGGGQAEATGEELARSGYGEIRILRDEEGDVRRAEARRV